MKFPRRTFVQLAASAAALPAVPGISRAQAWPSRPVRIVVGFPAGGATDIMARLMAEWLTERLGQQFIVENKPGASGNIGTETVAKAPADGYTLLQVVTPNAINAALYSNLPFDFVRDIAPVIYLARLAYVVVVNPAVPATTLPELIAYAKANPGKINYGSAGQGTPAEIIDMLNKQLNAGLADSKIKGRIVELGGTVTGGSPAAFGTIVSEATEKWAKVIKFAGVKAE